MRGVCISAGAILYVLGEITTQPAHVALLTVAQRDRVSSPGSPASASISADGRYIAFSSYQQLSAGDHDTLADIYVLDRTTGDVTHESMTVDGAELQASCLFPRISSDGRYLVFESAVMSGPTSLGFGDIVFRDRAADVSRRVSRSTTGEAADAWSSGAAVSDDGAVIVFESSATNLVSEADANQGRTDVYVVYTQTGRVARVSVDANNVQPPEGASNGPRLSADGRYVTFLSSAPLVSSPGRHNRQVIVGGRALFHVYLRDLRLNVTTRLNAPKGVPPNGPSYRPTISRDGAFVAFASSATNLVPDDRNGLPDVFLYDTRSGSITLVSRSAIGRPANGASGNPSISADGRFVAFQSEASDLVCARRCPPSAEDINLLPDVFLFDRKTERNTWVSRTDAGAWMEESGAPVLDGTGRLVAFSSKHPTDGNDTGHDFDLFVRMPLDPR